ncbi:MAG: hypothetical protein AB7N65_15875 [Vicinamibacterales bacterium]
MLRALRRTRLFQFAVVLSLLTALPASFATWHSDGDDPLCHPQLFVHDHSAHRVEPPAAVPSAPEHCAICHWVQLLRGADLVSRLLLPSSPSALHASIDLSALTSTLVASPSGRAPPACLSVRAFA